MALRDLFRGGRRERDDDRRRYPLDPLSRDSWQDESEARYGAQSYRDFDDERRHFNDRWEDSYTGAGYGRFSDEDRGERRSFDEDRGDERRYGGSGNPFYGQRPLMNAGSEYDYGYFGSRSGLPQTPWRSEGNSQDMDELVYGGRSFDADGSSQRRGQFSGRGPRGYRRSDERIKEDVCQCLTDDDHVDATNIEVAVNDRDVTLTGTVTSRMQKRHAEDIIERLPGVREVINNVRVVSDSQATQQGSQQGMQSTTRLGATYR